jgi:hypothetical protein
MVIKQILVVSLLFVSIPAMASIPCPTCKKSYVASSLEEALIAQQEIKKSALKKISLDKPFSEGKTEKTLPAKLPVEIIMSQSKRSTRENQTGSTQEASRALAPKRDKILEIANAPFKSSYVTNSFASNNQGHQNLRETSNRNLQYQLGRRIQ